MISGDQSRDKLNDRPLRLSKVEWKDRSAVAGRQLSALDQSLFLLGAVPSPNGRGQDAQMHLMALRGMFGRTQPSVSSSVFCS